MLTPKQLARLDNLFGRELGFNKFGEPRYRWKWSETFLHNMVLEGKQEWIRKELPPEGVEIPGPGFELNTGIGLYIPRPTTQVRKMCPWLQEQWIIAMWYWSPRDEWIKSFGSILEWPHRGFYMYVDGTDLPKGVEPTTHITSDFCGAMKHQQTKTVADLEAEVEAGMARQERHIDNHIDDVLSDATTAFGAAKPGTRSGGISIPSSEFSRNFDHLVSKEAL